MKLLPALHRRGVVSEWREHSPGSLVVRLQPITALLNAPRRRRDRDNVLHKPAGPQALSALDQNTLRLLRNLALRSLDSLGVRDTEKFVDAEMLEKFNSLAASIPEGEGSEERLQRAIATALEQLDE